jgi:hypothetical protein
MTTDNHQNYSFGYQVFVQMTKVDSYIEDFPLYNLPRDLRINKRFRNSLIR